MGHEIIDTTEDYVRFAKQYYRNANFDWIKAALKFHGEKDKKPTMEQENGLISKTPLKTLVSTGNNRSREVCSRRDSNPSLSLERA